MVRTEILRYAGIASKAWNSIKKTDQEKIKKYFHLRPTQSGVTLVTTLPFLPMRGKDKVQREDKLRGILQCVVKKYKDIIQDDSGRAKEVVLGLLEVKTGSRQDELEYNVQANLINHMSKDSNLQEILGSKDKIRFIASELIFERGPHRVDIVGYNGETLFLFEIKKDRTTNVKQVSDYVRYYQENFNVLKKLLQNYPINPVGEIEKIRGVMVMRYAESSTTQVKWKKLAVDNNDLTPPLRSNNSS